MDFPSSISDRENFILDQIKLGNFSYQTSEVSYEEKGNKVTFRVMSDALKIEGIRVNASARLLQKIADVTGLSMLTPKMADIVYNYTKLRIGPKPRPISSSNAAMISHSQDVDKALKALPEYDPSLNQLVDTVGKYWVLCNKVKNDRAATYGWHFVGSSYMGITGFPCESKMPYRCIQNATVGHDDWHVDYSQTVRLACKDVLVNDQPMNLLDLWKNPEMCYLVSHEGPLAIDRQPRIPNDYDGPIVLPMVKITA